MRAGMPRSAPVLFLLLLAFDVPRANAVVLGELRSSARVGQVLQAEIEVSEHPAERFDPACLKLFRPQSASDDLPWITEARLSYRREGGHGRLTIVSRAAITDPAVRLGVRSECAAGASRQYTILLADPMGVVASPPTPGAAPATALGKTDSRPAAVAAARPPAAAIPAQRPPVAVGESVRAGRVAAAKGEAAPLSASDELSEPVTTSGLGRELLRLEQRALAMLNDPADDQETMSNKLAWLEANVAELKRATERLQGGAAALPGGDPAGEPRLPAAGAGSASAPPAVAAQGGAPLAAATVPARSEAPPTVAESGSWLIYGAAALLLLLSLLLVRRRRNAAIEPLQPATAQAPARAAFGDSQFSLTPDAAAAVPIEQLPRRATVPSTAPSTAPSIAPTAAPSAEATRESTLAAAPPLAVDHGVGGAAPAIELAEIMLSFGRVSGAARTLEEYVAALPQESARPWIRLLHLYRRNGMRKEFEALTVKLNRNFNVEILAWETGKASGELELVPLAGAPAKAETLEDIPRLRDEIIALWGKPECHGYLEKLLRDNRQGKRKGFPLAVAEEILFLIDLAAARDAAR
jgi:pilus assembly protein FimV